MFFARIMHLTRDIPIGADTTVWTRNKGEDMAGIESPRKGRRRPQKRQVEVSKGR